MYLQFLHLLPLTGDIRRYLSACNPNIWTMHMASGQGPRAWVIPAAMHIKRFRRSIFQCRCCRESSLTICYANQGTWYHAGVQHHATHLWDILACSSGIHKKWAGIASLSATITFTGNLWVTVARNTAFSSCICSWSMHNTSASTMPSVTTKET